MSGKRQQALSEPKRSRRFGLMEAWRVRSTAQAAWVLIGVAGATLLLYIVPFGRFVLYPLMLLSTLVHETGHGVAALLVGGTFQSLFVYADGSGVAHTAVGSGLARAVVAAGGLVGPAVVGGVMFALARWRPVARGVLIGFGALAVVGCVLVIANPFGWAYTALVAALCLYVGIKKGSWSQHAVVFLATQLALSVYSRGDYLFTRWAETAAGRMPSDVELMARALPLPYWLWGALCAAFSLAVLGAGLASYLGLSVRRALASAGGLPRLSSRSSPAALGAGSRSIDAELGAGSRSVDAELSDLRRRIRGGSSER